MILVDATVLLDLVTDDPMWSSWSLARPEEAVHARVFFLTSSLERTLLLKVGHF